MYVEYTVTFDKSNLKFECAKYNYWGWGLAAWPLYHENSGTTWTPSQTAAGKASTSTSSQSRRILGCVADQWGQH